MPRHHLATVWGIPAPYAEMMNPRTDRETILERGAAIYTRNCLSCHGREGAGDGPAGRNLTPPPGNLVWLSDVPRKQWDAYMYWTIAEGGIALGTAMPAYKSSLSADEIWAATAYVQAYLPFDSHWR